VLAEQDRAQPVNLTTNQAKATELTTLSWALL